MSIKVGEVGKIYVYGTFFDLSGFTALDLEFTSPITKTVFMLTSLARVTAPAVDFEGLVEQPDGSVITQTLPASTYMQITTEATDFLEDGKYEVCGTYRDGTPKEFFGDKGSLTILAKC